MSLIRIVFFALLSSACFAGDETNSPKSSTFNSECKTASNNGAVEKGCLLEEKQKEAEENFQNFQENSHVDRTF